jgi:hypothetical protein
MTTHLDGVEYVGAIRQDIALGKLPTFTGFDTDPPNPAHITDGDITHPSGTGSTTIIGSGDLGRVRIDLGSPKLVLVGAFLGLWSDANTIRVMLETSFDCNLYTTQYRIVGDTPARSESPVMLLSSIQYTRSVGLRIEGSGAMTGNVKIYEIIALEVIL